jgi:hypothetical protein
MSNEEQHELLCEILEKLVDVLDCEELSLLAHHCGVDMDDFYGYDLDDPKHPTFIERMVARADFMERD